MDSHSRNTLIIIPCYNEESRLPIDEYFLFLESKTNDNIEFLFVNDGSSDSTIDLLKKLSAKFSSVSILDLNKNVGKAEAIRSAILETELSTYNYVGYFDADLATPLEEIHNLLTFTNKRHKPYIVVGSRVSLLGLTQIKRKLSRHYVGRIFATIVSNMLKLPIYDTQCGAKLIRQDIVKEIFVNPFISKWLFDIELFFRLKKNKTDFGNNIIEVPIKKWEDKDGSKIHTSYFLKAPIDLLKIYLAYR